METSALTFARPLWLNLLWLLPLVVLLFWWAEQRRRALLGRIVAPKLREQLAGSASPVRRWFRQACTLAAIGLLAVALAGPRLGYDTLEVPHRGRDVIIAMDVSRSMLASDVTPTRLQRAKLFAEDLVSEMGGDRIGLVAFAGSSFLQAPLTLDHGAVLAAVDEIDTDLIPRGGSNIAAAIRTAEEAFGKAEGFSRAMIIVSDGEELDADGVAAARQAAENGIRIFTVGIGSEEGAEIAVSPGEFVRDAAGKVVVSKLDAARMKEIAEVTGGFYLPLDAGTVQKLVTDGVGQLEEKQITASASRRPIERYQWPLGAAIALLILQALVGERRRRPVAVAAAMLWLTLTPSWAAPAEDGQANLEAVRKKYEDRLKMEPDAPNLQFNAGTAAYRLGDYDKAAEYFSRAMLSEDPELRSAAEYNLANTLFRAGEKQQDKKKKIADWKESIAKYETAMKTRADYTEAKENKERVEELLRQLEEEQKQEEQKQDKKQDQQNQQQKDQQKQDQQQQPDKGDQDKQEQPKDGQQKDQPSAEGGDKNEPQSGDSPEKKDGDKGQEPKNQKKGGQDQKEQGDQGDQPQEQGQKPDDQKDSGGEGDREKQDKKSGEGEQQGEEQKPEPGQNGRPGESQPEQSRDGERPAPLPQQGGEKKEGELRGGESAGQAGDQGEPMPVAAEEEVEGQMSESQARTLLRALQGEEEQVDLRERSPFQDVLRDW